MEKSWPNQEMNLCNLNLYAALQWEMAHEISAEKAEGLCCPVMKAKKKGEAYKMEQCNSA